jgi:hypothetical protein
MESPTAMHFMRFGLAVKSGRAGHGLWLDGASDGQFENSMVYRVSMK